MKIILNLIFVLNLIQLIYCQIDGGFKDGSILPSLFSNNDNDGYMTIRSYTDNTKGYTVSYNEYYSSVLNVSRIEMENTTIIDWNKLIGYTYTDIVYQFNNSLPCTMFNVSDNEIKLYGGVVYSQFNFIPIEASENDLIRYGKYNDFNETTSRMFVNKVLDNQYYSQVVLSSGSPNEYDQLIINDVIGSPYLINSTLSLYCSSLSVNCTRLNEISNTTCTVSCKYYSMDIDGNWVLTSRPSFSLINIGKIDNDFDISYNEYFNLEYLKIDSFSLSNKSNIDWKVNLIILDMSTDTFKIVNLGNTSLDGIIHIEEVYSSFSTPFDNDLIGYLYIPSNSTKQSQCVSISNSEFSSLLINSNNGTKTVTPSSNSTTFPFQNFNGSFSLSMYEEFNSGYWFDNYVAGELKWSFDSVSKFESILEFNTILTIYNHQNHHDAFTANLETFECKNINELKQVKRDKIINPNIQKVFMPTINSGNDWVLKGQTIFRGIDVNIWTLNESITVYLSVDGWKFPGRQIQQVSLPYPVAIKWEGLNRFKSIYLFTFDSISQDHDLFQFDHTKCFPSLPDLYSTWVMINSEVNGITLEFNETYTYNNDGNKILYSIGKYGNQYPESYYNHDTSLYINRNEDTCIDFMNYKSSKQQKPSIANMLKGFSFTKSVPFFYAQSRNDPSSKQQYITSLNYRGRNAHQWRIVSGSNINGKTSNRHSQIPPYFNLDGYNTSYIIDLYYELVNSSIETSYLSMEPLSVTLNFNLIPLNSSLPIIKNHTITVDWILFDSSPDTFDDTSFTTNGCQVYNSPPNHNVDNEYYPLNNSNNSLSNVLLLNFTSIIEVKSLNSLVSVYNWNYNNEMKYGSFNLYNFTTKSIKNDDNNHQYCFNLNGTTNIKVKTNETLLNSSPIFKLLHSSTNLKFISSKQVLYKGVPVDVWSNNNNNNNSIIIYYYPLDWVVKKYPVSSNNNNNTRIPISIKLIGVNSTIVEQWDFFNIEPIKYIDPLIYQICKNFTIVDTSKDSNKIVNNKSTDSKHLSRGGIAAIIISSVLCLVAIVGASSIFVYHKYYKPSYDDGILLDDNLKFFDDEKNKQQNIDNEDGANDGSGDNNNNNNNNNDQYEEIDVKNNLI